MKKIYIQPMMQVLGLTIESQILNGSGNGRAVTSVQNDDGIKMKSDGIWGSNTLR